MHRERERLLVVEEEERHSFDFVDWSMAPPAVLLLVLLLMVSTMPSLEHSALAVVAAVVVVVTRSMARMVLRNQCRPRLDCDIHRDTMPSRHK